METEHDDWVNARYTTRSRSGAIAVTTTAQGLPIAVRLTESAMSLTPRALATGILAQCDQSRIAAGIALREVLAAHDVDDEVLATMKLPTTDDLACAQSADDAHSAAPRSWLR